MTDERDPTFDPLSEPSGMGNRLRLAVPQHTIARKRQMCTTRGRLYVAAVLMHTTPLLACDGSCAFGRARHDGRLPAGTRAPLFWGHVPSSGV